ncbi:MAG: nitroreductase family protein [Thermodesulfobacteriota bacterium]
MARTALFHYWMAQAPLSLVITAESSRTRIKYRERGTNYAMIEAGHIGQNIFLMAETVGLGAGIVGAFYGEAVNRLTQTPRTHEFLLIMPAGHKN